MADKFGPNNAFHDWLSASSYVRGADQTARVVSKKKHRSKRSAGISDIENERLEAEQRIRVIWKLSNRHYRRWMNDRLLRELAPPLDATEISSLFAPPPWGEKSVPSPFERVSAFGEGSARDVEAWEPFRNNVDMDVEAKALQRRVRHQGKNLGIDARRHNAAIVAWQGVSHRSRDVLRRNSSWHLVNLFEVNMASMVIITCIASMEASTRAVVARTEEEEDADACHVATRNLQHRKQRLPQQHIRAHEKILDYLKEIERGGSSFLVLDVDDAYHRMLIHGICEFHHLSSKTISNTEDGECTALMIKVNAKRKSQEQQADVPVSLMQFLTDANKRTFFCSAGT